MESVGDRLQKIMDMENLTPAQFSELMSIQRSAVSHLVSGRNKPSFDLLLKLIQRFPTLNLDWLMTGKGKPYKSSETSMSENASRTLPVIFDQNIQTPDKETQTIDNEVETAENEEQHPSEISTNSSSSSDDGEKSQSQRVISASRNIMRITVFYSDGTFEEKF